MNITHVTETNKIKWTIVTFSEKEALALIESVVHQLLRGSDRRTEFESGDHFLSINVAGK